MQPLRLAADPEAGLVHMLDRRNCHLVTHDIGEALEALGAVVTDPGDRCRGQPHAEQIGHQRGETFLRQQLVVQQVEHDGADPLAMLAPEPPPNQETPPVSVLRTPRNGSRAPGVR